jgi:hypothetical protein
MNRYEQLKQENVKRQRKMGITGDTPQLMSRPRRTFGYPVAVLALAALVLAAAAAGYFGWQRFWRGNADAGLEQAAERYKHAVGLVVIEPKEGGGQPKPAATAWAIGPKRFATCAHVVEKVSEVMGQGGRVYIALNGLPDRRLYVCQTAIHDRYGRVLGAGAKDIGYAFDVALLEVDGGVKVWFPVADGREIARIKPGYRVALLGYPMERLVQGGVDARNPVAVMQSGIVTAVSDFGLADAGVEGNLLIRHNLGMTGGCSGSPLFNPRGEVVGIANAGNMTKQMTGLDAKGNPVVARAPSAAMVNFAQRVDTLDGVVWKEGRKDATSDITAAAAKLGTAGNSHRENQPPLAAEAEALDRAELALRQGLGSDIVAISRSKDATNTYLIVQFAAPPEDTSSSPAKPPPDVEVAAAMSATKSAPSALDRELAKPKPPEITEWYTEKLQKVGEVVENFPVRIEPVKNPSGKVDGAIIKYKWGL